VPLLREPPGVNGSSCREVSCVILDGGVREDQDHVLPAVVLLLEVIGRVLYVVGRLAHAVGH
jgi:hypothetical protein